MKKIISLFMIAILVCVSFTLYSPQEVSAAAVNTCALTKDGNFCVFGEDVESNDCVAGHFYTGKTLSQVDECKLGTCIPQEGECLAQKPQIECISNENKGRWDPQPKESIPECQIGCCNIAGSLCSLEEKNYCVNTLAGGDASSFNSAITDKASCDTICNAAVLGCYNNNGVCNYGTQENFLSLPDFNPGNFKANTFCKDVSGCFADSQAYKSCGDKTTNEDYLDVYWYDSSGNREEIFDDCGYPDEFCYDEDDKGGINAECIISDCVSGLDQYAEPGEFKAGESICVGVSNYHYTNEGRSKEIKPYILSCQFGEIKADDTLDRNVVCVEQKDGEGRIHAQTIDNKEDKCNPCGLGGGLLGQAGDIFGYFPPGINSIFLLTTEPCKGDSDFPVLNGDRCDQKGQVTLEDGQVIQMCGYGPLDSDNSYDNDVWDPVGSCNPIYPPSDTTRCNLCGEGGDGILNVCTVDECNALGDCKFLKDNRVINAGTAVAGGMWLGTCISGALLSQYTPLPAVREGLLASVAATCTGTAGSLAFSIYASVVMLSTSIAASASTQETQDDEVKFELTKEGKIRLGDLATLQKTISNGAKDTDYSGLGLSIGGQALSLAFASESSREFTLYLAKQIVTLGGTLKYTFVEKAYKWWIKKTVEGNARAALKPYLGKQIPEEVSKKFQEKYGIITKGNKVTENSLKTLPKRAGEEAIEEESTKKAISNIALNVFNVLLTVYNIYSTGQSFNTGQCVPEDAYTNNNKCELCGPGEGQWFCTQERCNILGQTNGHCKWISKDDATNDGNCIPVDVSDANPPIINKINAKIYDNNNNFVGEEYESSKKTLDIDLTTLNNAWRATNVTINFETNEDSTCIYTKQSKQTFETDSFGEENGFSKQHKLSVDFTDGDKTAGTLPIYLKCMDVNENIISDDNSYVKIIFPPRPDTEPPVVKYIDPIKVMLPENTRQLNVQLISYDEKLVTGCKYSESQSDYESMESAFASAGRIDCPDLVSGNNKCNIFTTNLDVSSGGTQINYDNIRSQYPDAPEEVLTSLEGMRTYFYNISCIDPQGNSIEEPYRWSLSVVPGFDITINAPNVDVYNKIMFNISTGGNPTICSYFIDNNPTQYNFTDLFAYDNSVEHDGYLSEGSHTVRFECQDYPGNKATKESTFNVIVEDLIINSITPNDETIYSDTINLEVKTQGGLYANGNSTCTYDGNEIEDKFTVGNETTHTMEITGLTSGTYNYDIVCVDDAGKRDSEEITFRIDLASVPGLTAVYTEGSLLSIETSSNSECKYSDSNFDYGAGGVLMTSSDGFKHQAVLQDVFYIYCKNLNNDNINLQPFIIYP